VGVGRRHQGHRGVRLPPLRVGPERGPRADLEQVAPSGVCLWSSARTAGFSQWWAHTRSSCGTSSHGRPWARSASAAEGSTTSCGGAPATSSSAYSRVLAWVTGAEIILWDVGKGQPIAPPLRAHETKGVRAPFEAVAFSPDSKMMAKARDTSTGHGGRGS